jgi:hypothetical protein
MKYYISFVEVSSMLLNEYSSQIYNKQTIENSFYEYTNI